MPILKTKNCEVCSKTYQPTGRCSRYCEDHKAEQARLRQLEGQTAFRHRQGKPVGVGKGGSNKTYKEHKQYSSGLGNFHSLRKEMRNTIKQCERCSLDLSKVSRWYWCVHHKDHNRTNNERDNLEMLCKRCHQVHHDCVTNLSN